MYRPTSSYAKQNWQETHQKIR